MRSLDLTMSPETYLHMHLFLHEAVIKKIGTTVEVFRRETLRIHPWEIRDDHSEEVKRTYGRIPYTSVSLSRQKT